MKKILFISTFLLVLLIAIGCASAADVEANDGMIDGPAIADAMVHDHGGDVDEGAVHPDDSGIVDNRTVPDDSGIVDNRTVPDDYGIVDNRTVPDSSDIIDDIDDDSLEPDSNPFYKNDTVIPDGSDMIDNRTVPNSSDIIDNRSVPDSADIDSKEALDNGGNRNNDSNSSSSKHSSMDLEDIINNDYDSHVEGIYVTNPDLDMCIVDSYGYELIINYVNELYSCINMKSICSKIANLKSNAHIPFSFNYEGKESVKNMIPDYIGCPDYDLGQGWVNSGNFLCLG